jgi:hypothetical protein
MKEYSRIRKPRASVMHFIATGAVEEYLHLTEGSQALTTRLSLKEMH